MIVRCVDSGYAVTVGRDYVVYAVTLRGGRTGYCVLDDDGRSWPSWQPAELFDVLDGTLAAGWRLGQHRLGPDQYPIVSFPEWAEDDAFYERLVDGDPDTVRVFGARRSELERRRVIPVGEARDEVLPEDDVLRASVDELVDTMRGALLAVVPSAQRANLEWTDLNPHDDWDALGEALFDTFVRGPVRAHREHLADVLPLGRYDFDLRDYSEFSWIAVPDEGGVDRAFVRFLSREHAFDTVQVVAIDPETLLAGERTTLPYRDATFACVRRRRSGERETLTWVEADD